MNALPEIRTAENIDAEQALLGAIFADNRALDAVTAIVEPEHFSEQIHRLIFEACLNLQKMGRKIDPVTILPHVPKDEEIEEGVTVRDYLLRLYQAAPVTFHAKDYAAGVYDAWLRRQAVTACEEAIRAAVEIESGDILEEIGALEAKLSEIRGKRLKTDDGKRAGGRYLDAMTAAAQRGEVAGVPICLPEIASVISEPVLEVGNLYGMLASSGEGKTSLTLQFILHVLEQGHPVQFLSFDQSDIQCVRQFVAQKYGIRTVQQREARLSQKEWGWIHDFGNWIDRHPFEVIKCTNENAAQLKGYARQFIRRHSNGKTPLIVVDHIKAVTPEDRRADPGTQASQKNRLFKWAAEETGSAWLVLNQRNTSGVNRPNPRPIASDLFGGEGARQDYDAIFYLYRFKKFADERRDIAVGKDHAAIDAIFPPDAVADDLAELGVIKSRFGNPSRKERVQFEAEYTRYKSLREKPQEDLGL